MEEKKIIDRFIRYVKVDSQSDPEGTETPSTQKQWDIVHLLVEELKEIGLSEVEVDQYGYIMATLPSNVSHTVPTIGFIAHYDTSPDFSGANVNPQFVHNYDGGDIVLNAKENIVLSSSYFPDLKKYIGHL